MVKPNALLSTLYSVVAIYTEFFFGLVISILVARQLGPQQFGVYGYMMWISSLLITLVSGGIALGAIKFIAEARASLTANSRNKLNINAIVNLHRYFQSLLQKRIVFFGIVSCGVVYTMIKLQLTIVDPTMLSIIIIAAMIKAYHMYYVGVLKGFEDFRALAILSLLITPFNLILVLICFFTKQTLIVYVWVYLAVSTMYLIITYFLFKKNIRNKQLPQNIGNTLTEQRPPLQLKSKIFSHVRTASWIAILNFIVLRQSELFFLNIFATAEVMAYFNVGFTLASAAMTLVPGVYSAILMPLMARINKAEGLQIEKQLKLSLRYMLQLIIALLFPICYFAKDIFILLYGTQYLNAIFPFQIIIACVAFKTLADCTNAYLWSKDKQSLMLKVIIVGSIVTLLLDFYLIKLYQLHGALLAFSISTLFFVSLNIALVLRKLNSKLEWLIYIKTILSGLIAILIISPTSYYLPNISGLIVGGLIYIVIYFVLLLSTFSLSFEDITQLRKLNQRLFNYHYLERFLVLIQNRTRLEA